MAKNSKKYKIAWRCRTCHMYHPKDKLCGMFKEPTLPDYACYNWRHWHKKDSKMLDVADIDRPISQEEKQEPMALQMEQIIETPRETPKPKQGQISILDF